jgi:potassium efflux system protein
MTGKRGSVCSRRAAMPPPTPHRKTVGRPPTPRGALPRLLTKVTTATDFEKRQCPWCRRVPAFVLAVALALSVQVPSHAQSVVNPAPAPAQPAATAAAQPAMPAAPLPVPVADVAVEAETALSIVRQIENDSSLGGATDPVATELTRLVQAAAVHGAQTRRLLTRNASLETIRSLVYEWRDIEARASSITRNLTRTATQLDRDLARLDQLSATWQATSKAAAAAAAPLEVLERIRGVTANVSAARAEVLERRAEVLGLQSRSATLDSQATAARQALADASERATARLLYADSPPLWSDAFREGAANMPLQEADINIASQLQTVARYANTHRVAVLSHIVFFFFMVGLMRVARKRVRALCVLDKDLLRASKVFEMPVVTALLIALLACTWFYERPPRIFWTLISLLGTVPILLFARRVIEPHLYSVLYGLIGFYLLDKLRLLVGPLPIVARILFIAEALLAIVFIGWMLYTRRLHSGASAWVATTSSRVVRASGRAALVLVGVATFANVAGYVRLSELIGGAFLASAYAAVVLYSLTRVVEGLMQGLLHVPPMSRSGIVQRHRSDIAHRATRWIKRIAFAVWIGLTLRMLGLLDAAAGLLQSTWQASASIGSLTVSVGEVVTLLFFVWAAVMLSRLVRFVLNEEIFPKLNLERGLPYAVSTIIHYVIVVTGIVLALGAIGVDMTKFTILAGALTVGIGFGLQNIVNNFVSGLIVLFERPVKVGDTIQLDDITGRVERIGIRASTVHSTTGADVVVPNGKLISDKLINWTLSDRLRQVTVPVVTKPDADIARTKETLTEIAGRHPLVLDRPGPEVLFTRRAMDAFEFELRIWTDAPDQWQQIRSTLMSNIDEALRQTLVAEPEDQTQLPLDFEPSRRPAEMWKKS